MENHRNVQTIGNHFFICIPITSVKRVKPVKVPKVEKFYKLPDSRAVVESGINTGIAARCFCRTLLVAFAQIKDFQVSVRHSLITVSIFPVPGNISTQHPRSIRYPFSRKTSRSLARLVGLQEIYTIRSTP